MPIISGGRECLKCGGSAQHVVKNGLRSGRQRYRCRLCGGSFTDTTGTSAHRIREDKRDKFYDAAVLMYAYEFDPVEAAEETGVALSTIYSWRKKIEADAELMRELTAHKQHLRLLLNLLEKATERGLLSSEERRQVLESPEFSQRPEQVLRWLLSGLAAIDRQIREMEDTSN